MKSNCKLRTFDGNEIKDLSCEYVRNNIHEIKSEFRKKNGTDRVLESGSNDRYYDMFCKTFDDFLINCKCLDVCDICPEEDVTPTGFCRCEGRNIAWGKQRRLNGIQWKE